MLQYTKFLKKHKIISFSPKIVLLFFIAFISFPLTFNEILPGLDTSWSFALNYFNIAGIKFGKDVIFTFGPLGFLMYPQNIGNHVYLATFFWLTIWGIFIALIWRLFLRNIPKINLFIFMVFYILGYSTRLSADYLLCYLVLFMLAIAWRSQEWVKSFIAAIIVTVVCLFMKFSSALLCISAIISFILALLFIQKNKAKKAALLFIIFMPALFMVSYLFYNPSLSNMVTYLKGAVHICSGYSIAMSRQGNSVTLIIAIVDIALYCIFLAFILLINYTDFLFCLIFAAPIGIVFKHGFVRQDNYHTFIFFSFIMLIWSIMMLFLDFNKIGKNKLKKIAVLIVSFFILINIFYLKPRAIKLIFDQRKHIETTIKCIFTAENFRGSYSTKLLQDKLPDNLRQRIANKRIAIFPWEISYVAANNLNYAPFPIFQTYSAYTSYLDSLNAQYLENQDIAPELILMEWKSIDYRNPLLDIPRLWLAVYKFYEVVYNERNLLLLQRRKEPRFEKLQYVEKKTYKNNDTLYVPNLECPILIKIHMTLNPLGILSKLFFRIPAVYLGVYDDVAQDYVIFRVVPEVLKNGFMNVLITSLNDINKLVNNNMGQRFNKVKFFGPGIKFYKQNLHAEFYRIQY